jgi:hypothetical protein
MSLNIIHNEGAGAGWGLSFPGSKKDTCGETTKSVTLSLQIVAKKICSQSEKSDLNIEIEKYTIQQVFFCLFKNQQLNFSF